MYEWCWYLKLELQFNEIHFIFCRWILKKCSVNRYFSHLNSSSMVPSLSTTFSLMHCGYDVEKFYVGANVIKYFLNVDWHSTLGIPRSQFNLIILFLNVLCIIICSAHLLLNFPFIQAFPDFFFSYQRPTIYIYTL